MNKKSITIYIFSAVLLLNVYNGFAQFGGMKLPSTKDVRKKVEKEVKDSGETEDVQSDASKDSGDERKSSGTTRNSGKGEQDSEQILYNQLATKYNTIFFYNKVGVIAEKTLSELEEIAAKFDYNVWKEKYSGKKAEDFSGDVRWERCVREIDGIIKSTLEFTKEKLNDMSLAFYDEIEQKQSPSEKAALFDRLKRACNLLLKLSPDNDEIVAKIKEVEKISQKNTKQLSGIAKSSVHASNINKMLFSSSLIDPEKATETDFKTKFTSSESIFCTIFFDRKLSEIQVDWEKFVLLSVLKGKVGNDFILIEKKIILKPEMYEKPYLQFAFIPDQQWLDKNYQLYAENANPMYVHILESLSKVTPIPQFFRLDTKFNCVKGILHVEGLLSLDLSDGVEQYEKLGTTLSSINLENVSLPKAQMNNKALENKMISIMKEKSTVQEYKKAIITASQWSIEKNGIGVILHRYIPAVLTSKNNDGKCYYQEFTFKQVYTGGGSYSQTLELDGVGKKVEMSCEEGK